LRERRDRRPYDSLLRTHQTGWLILAENETRLQAKLNHYFPEGPEKRYAGPWRDFVLAGTPAAAVSFKPRSTRSRVLGLITANCLLRDSET